MKLSTKVCGELLKGNPDYAGAGWKYISTGNDFHMLYHYASKCASVTEFGTFDWNGTWAFIDSGIKKLRCYDIGDYTGSGRAKYGGNPLRERGGWKDIQKACAENEIDFQFILEDTSECVIEETDMLFVDSLHIDTQVRAELKNADRVRKYILFHDTILYGIDGQPLFTKAFLAGTECSEPLLGRGILQVIDEFIGQNKDNWEVVEHHKGGMGMMVIGRKI